MNWYWSHTIGSSSYEIWHKNWIRSHDIEYRQTAFFVVIFLRNVEVESRFLSRWSRLRMYGLEAMGGYGWAKERNSRSCQLRCDDISCNQTIRLGSELMKGIQFERKMMFVRRADTFNFCRRIFAEPNNSLPEITAERNQRFLIVTTSIDIRSKRHIHSCVILWLLINKTWTRVNPNIDYSLKWKDQTKK